MEFKKFLEQQDADWKASKDEILQFWQNLKPNLPMQMRPVPPWHKGTRYEFDGVRVTGSPEFISGVLSRLKEILPYESFPQTKLDLEYRKIVGKDNKQNTVGSYVFYVHAIPKQKN